MCIAVADALRTTAEVLRDCVPPLAGLGFAESPTGSALRTVFTQLARSLPTTTLMPGEVLIGEGETVRAMHILLSGFLVVSQRGVAGATQTRPNRTRTLATLRRGAVVGEISFLLGASSNILVAARSKRPKLQRAAARAETRRTSASKQGSAGVAGMATRPQNTSALLLERTVVATLNQEALQTVVSDDPDLLHRFFQALASHVAERVLEMNRSVVAGDLDDSFAAEDAAPGGSAGEASCASEALGRRESPLRREASLSADGSGGGGGRAVGVTSWGTRAEESGALGLSGVVWGTRAEEAADERTAMQVARSFGIDVLDEVDAEVRLVASVAACRVRVEGEERRSPLVHLPFAGGAPWSLGGGGGGESLPCKAYLFDGAGVCIEEPGLPFFPTRRLIPLDHVLAVHIDDVPGADDDAAAPTGTAGAAVAPGAVAAAPPGSGGALLCVSLQMVGKSLQLTMVETSAEPFATAIEMRRLKTVQLRRMSNVSVDSTMDSEHSNETSPAWMRHSFASVASGHDDDETSPWSLRRDSLRRDSTNSPSPLGPSPTLQRRLSSDNLRAVLHPSPAMSRRRPSTSSPAHRRLSESRGPGVLDSLDEGARMKLRRASLFTEEYNGGPREGSNRSPLPAP